MSQAGFGDSSSQESINASILKPQTQSQTVSSGIVGEPTTLFNALPRQILEQELQFCNERSQQAQILLRQAQEQLQLSQLVIQRQETLTLTLQSRIDQLERELQDVHTNGDELRDRLKRQQHHTSQLKAALERCLDTSTPAPKDMALMALESWSSAKLADEKIHPVEAIRDSALQNVVKIVPAPQPIDLPIDLLNEQESATFTSEEKQSEVIQLEAIEEQPIHLSMPDKIQPISPLIVRPHKASQGSPIAPNLPTLQIANSQVSSQIQVDIEPSLELMIASPVNLLNDSQVKPQVIAANDNNFIKSSNSLNSSNSEMTNPSRLSTVVAPKFIQALYGSTENIVNESREEPAQLAITDLTPRKAVTSLAAVQLPQFLPLLRR